MKRVLVIGGAGYLGSVLCRRLLVKGYTVRVLDSLLYGDKGISSLYSNPNFEFIHGDIRDMQIVMKSVKGVDFVIHLAGIVGDPAGSLNPDETIQINFLATKIIILVCDFYNVKRLVFASTCSVYGDNNKDVLIDEEGETKPLSLYAEMKLKSETEIYNSNIDFCILRMGTLYGFSPRMRFDLVVNLFIADAVKTGKISFFGGDQFRCFCHVSDVADAYIKCLQTKAFSCNIFNVSSSNSTIADIANDISGVVDDVEISSYERKGFDKRSYRTTSDKIQNYLSWSPEWSFIDFIREFVGQKDCWDNYMDDIYNNYEHLKKKLK